MTSFAKEIIHKNIEDEMRQSYLDYAMSVIAGRALPDVRDGLKPVHRRILYAMYELDNAWNKPYKKSARVVGDVIGKLHPHGDTAVYDAIVRMAQEFSLRYMLIEGQGNFGSVDGDAAAAMRYTEIRLSKISHEIIRDIDKETVHFLPNYDDTEVEPSVMPTRVPQLIINGSQGIAVGMATSIPPHNLKEVMQATIALLEDSDITVDGLMEYILGPDFPTAGIIMGRKGIIDAYRSGHGRVVVRARCDIETNAKTNRSSIIISELPYMVNKARLIEKIAFLVKNKKLEGISELRDESDKDGMRVVIALKQNEVSKIILNSLYKNTSMEAVISMNMIAIDHGRPKNLNLKEILNAFLGHRREVITKRSRYELRKAREKTHILEGQAVALANIDEVIALIKNSPTPQLARTALMEKLWKSGGAIALIDKDTFALTRPPELPQQYGLSKNGYLLSEVQARAILELRLQRLTALEQEKIIGEYQELVNKIHSLVNILSNPDGLLAVMRGELTETLKEFGDDRRTDVNDNFVEMSDEDYIAKEEVMVTVSHLGYTKYQPVDSYQAQKRGGRGKNAASVKEEDFIDSMFIANTHDYLLCFSTKGRVYWCKVYQLPKSGRSSRGRPLVNILNLSEDERVTTILPVHQFDEEKSVIMATQYGTIKKTPLAGFSRPRARGIIGINLVEGDQMIGAALVDDQHDVMLFSNTGKAIRFPANELRNIGRTARGVRGMRVDRHHKIISIICLDHRVLNDIQILVATKNGYGKRTKCHSFPVRKRGGMGVISIQTSKRNGEVVGAIAIGPKEDVMLITSSSTLVRLKASDISTLSRNTQGVKLIKLDTKTKATLCEIVRTVTEEEEQIQE